MAPQAWRFIAYLIGIVLMVVGPVAGGLVAGLGGPPPYLLRPDGLTREDQSPRLFPDGSVVVVHTFQDDAAAREGVSEVTATVPRSQTERLPGLVRYTRRDGSRRGLVAAAGPCVVHIEAPDDRTIDARLARLPYIVRNPEKNPVFVLFSEHLGAFFVGLALYLMLVAVAMGRGAAWAALVPPAPGTLPAPPEAVRERLLQVGALDVPFQVREERPGHLVAEWRVADTRWAPVLERGGLTILHRIHLELDPAEHKVRARDEERRIAWSGGVAGLGLGLPRFRGLTFFEYERAAALGLFFNDGEKGQWTVRPAYNYRFALSEMKVPLIEAITGSGWSYAPVATFFRPLGG